MFNRLKLVMQKNYATQFIFKFSVFLLFLSAYTVVGQTAEVTKEYYSVNADYCNYLPGTYYNFYWFEQTNSPFFASTENSPLSLVEYDDGTALIEGVTVQGNCMLQLHIVLKDKMDWTQWVNSGGTFKEGMGCTNPVKEALKYYVIDNDKSYAVATGGDCIEEGTMKITQRPDPLDLNTPHLGVHMGPGGVLYDTDSKADGIAGWGWMGPESDKRKYRIDFNFLMECADGCEGVENIKDEVTVCKDDSYTWNIDNMTYTAQDSPVVIELKDENGCDYMATLIINEHPETEDVEKEVSVCPGGSYTWDLNDNTYTVNDSPVVITLQDENGCDYKATLVINENAEPEDVEDHVTVCKGESYTWPLNNMTYTVQDSPVVITVKDDNGCDYIATLTIDEHPETEDVEMEANVCPGGSYTWDLNNTSYTANDSPVMITLQDKNGCDYKATLVINENNVPDDIEEKVTVCKGASYTWPQNNMTYTVQDSPVVITVKDDNDCEYMATLTIDEHPETEDILKEVNVCPGGSYTWDVNNMTYTVGDSPVMITLQDENGCDYKATLMISEHNVPNDIEQEVKVCKGASYTWPLNNMSYTVGESPVMITLKDDNGCEYMATLKISEHPETEAVEEEVYVCYGAEYTWSLNNMTYTASDSPVMITLQDENGCDYMASLKINEHPEVEHIEEKIELCPDEEYVWSVDGETYSLSDSPVELDLTDENGCPYTATLIINEKEDCDNGGGGGCETAFARLNESSICFINDPDINTNRWGWTNFFDTEGQYTMNVYSGAGQCDISKGTFTAQAFISYEDGNVSVTVETLPGFSMTEIHVYVGEAKYPVQGNSPTVAPGQYPYINDQLDNETEYSFNDIDVSEYTDGFYVIVHAVICGNGDNQESKSFPEILGTAHKPGSNTFSVKVQMPTRGKVDLDLYDISGKRVMDYKPKNVHQGENKLEYNIYDLSSKLYIIKIRSGNSVLMKKTIFREQD